MRKRTALLAIGGMVLSLLVPTTSARAKPPETTQADTPPPGKITLEIKTVNGTGCPPGSATAALADDKTAITVTYSKYLTQVGPAPTPTKNRLNCQLAMVAHVPSAPPTRSPQPTTRGYASLA